MNNVEIRHRRSSEVLATGPSHVEAIANALRAGTDLRGADLRGANLSGASLRGVDLRYAHLEGADLADACLSGANLSGVCLRGANLKYADLRGADLRRANLRVADLSDAHLRYANLSGADLSDAHLRGADLRGVYLSDAHLSGARLNWQSHDILSEILGRDSTTIEQWKIAGFVLIRRDLCWDELLDLGDPLTAWALGVLRKYVVGGDSHPSVLDLDVPGEVSGDGD